MSVREIPTVLLLDQSGHATVSGDDPEHTPPPRRRHRRLVKALVALLVALVLLAVAAVGAALMMQSHLAGQVQRIDNVFDGLDHRPARPTTGTAADAVNILVMGTDRRSEQPTTGSGASAPEWVPGAQRTDTIMVMHVDGDREGASLISIPRDTWVDVPGYGKNKINAAFSFAGPSLAVATVERMTGVRIDHLAVLDWAGFEALTDIVGGVTVTVPRTIEDPQNDVVWVRGRQTLDGSQALLYARQRYGLPMGDLDRVRRQQALMRGLMRSSLGTLRSTQPMDIYDLLDTATQHISVDSGWSFEEMKDLVLDLRGVRPESMDFLTVPIKGFGREGAQSVVYVDRAASRALWNDVRDDQVDEWAADNPASAVTGSVR